MVQYQELAVPAAGVVRDFAGQFRARAGATEPAGKPAALATEALSLRKASAEKVARTIAAKIAEVDPDRIDAAALHQHAVLVQQALPFDLSSVPAPRSAPAQPRLRATMVGLGAVCGLAIGGFLLARYPENWAPSLDPGIRRLIESLITMLLAALGAFAGAAAVAFSSPALDGWLASPLEWVKKTVLPLLAVGLRRSLGILLGVGAVAVVLAVLALILWLTIGTTSPPVLVGLAAFAGLVMARLERFEEPSAESAHAATGSAMGDGFEAVLRADAEALIGFALGKLEGTLRAPPPATGAVADIGRIVSSITPKDDLKDVIDRIRVALGLVDDKPRKREFTWSEDMRAQFNVYGLVKAGDTVEVAEQPVIVERGGEEIVERKGLVMKKSR